MRLSDAGLGRHRTKLFYPDHHPLPPWLTEEAIRDRSNRLLGSDHNILVIRSMATNASITSVPQITAMPGIRATFAVATEMTAASTFWLRSHPGHPHVTRGGRIKAAF